MSNTKTLLYFLGTIAVVFFLGYILRDQSGQAVYEPALVGVRESELDPGSESGMTEDDAKNSEPISTEVEIISENLSIPWEITFLPDGDLLVPERPGNLIRIGSNGARIPIEGVNHVGEGGLLGLALHPRFEQNRLLYLYLTTKSGNGLTNRIEKYRFIDNELQDRSVLLEGIPGAQFHDGGRMAFGPDGYLYVTTGDAGKPNRAQDLNSLAGKLLRMKDDGSIPKDNPFGSLVYSFGHRNAQGIAWDDQGRLWATEHGRSGILSGFDELNLIEKGMNYGWPVIQGGETREEMRSPVIHSGAHTTWAPAGITWVNGNLFYVGLRGESLYQVKTHPDGTVSGFQRHFIGEYGRLRVIVLGPDGYLYLATSNQDGRGKVREGDDKILKVHPSRFQ